MEPFGSITVCDIGRVSKKKRSVASRRPRSEHHKNSDYHDISYLSSSTAPSDSVSKVSSDENTGNDSSSLRKTVSLSRCITKESSIHAGSVQTSKRCKERAIAPPKSKCLDSHSAEGPEEKKQLNRVMLKADGVVRRIHVKSSSNSASAGGPSLRASEATRARQKLTLQNSDEDDSPTLNDRKVDSLRGRVSEESVFMTHSGQHEPLRKSKRAPKRRIVKEIGDDSDDEIRYLERLKTSKLTADYGSKNEDDEEEEGNIRRRNVSMVLKKHKSHGEGQYAIDVGIQSSRSNKDGKRSRSGKSSKTIYYVEDEELVSDNDLESERKNPRNELAVTTRQRALRNGKDPMSNSGASAIEYPNGLPPAPPRKQKEQLTEVEQQLKKVEAAQKRRMQVEKAARESEAEAIRKILGQDSTRKKREDKIKKRQVELAQEKAANALVLAANSVRWVIGPKGTVVTFSNDMGLPSIFEPQTCSYPPPRGKCAGPSCTNPYKYRDSKSNLPLCSLQCYKAVHENPQPVSPC